MPVEQHSKRGDSRSIAELRRAVIDPNHASRDCHELVVRLKAQAECLEEILLDIRGQIDELECSEILDQIRDTLEPEA